MIFMQNFIPYLLFALGMLLILKGADWLVGAGRYFARRLGVSELVIGVTLVSICTTLPETALSVTASLNHQPSLAVATVLGSIAANLGLILGLLFFIARPEIKDKKSIIINCVMLLVALVFLGLNFMLFNSGVTQGSGFLFLALFILFISSNIRNAKKHPSSKKVEADTSKKALGLNILFFLLGCVGIVTGALLLVKQGIKIAELWQLPTMVVGMTLTAIGTALPELVSALIALRKKSFSLSVGNLLGSGILNILLAIGAGAAVRGFNLPPIFQSYHFPALLLMVSGVLLFTLYGDRRYTRLNGGILFFMYLTYLWIGTLTSAS